MLREVAKSADNDPHFAAFAYSVEKLVTDKGYEFGKLLVLVGLTPLITLFIIVTNILLIVTIVRNKHLHKPFNFYIVSLCVSDLFAVEWIVPYLIFYVTRDATLWNTNMHAFFLVAAFLNTMYTVVALSVHRFRGIVQPLKRGFTKRQTAYNIAYMWTSVIVFTAIYAGIKYHCYPNVHEIKVNGTCPDVKIGFYNAFGFMHLLIIIFGYFIPIIVSAVLCAITAYKLKFSIVGKGMQSKQSVQSKTRAFKMVVSLFVLFVVFWSPYWMFMIYWHQTRRDPLLYFQPGTAVFRRANFLHNTAIFVALCYSWINMFVYMYFGRDLRRAVWGTLTCGRYPREEPLTITHSSGTKLSKLGGGLGGASRSATDTSLVSNMGAGSASSASIHRAEDSSYTTAPAAAAAAPTVFVLQGDDAV